MENTLYLPRASRARAAGCGGRGGERSRLRKGLQRRQLGNRLERLGLRVEGTMVRRSLAGAQVLENRIE